MKKNSLMSGNSASDSNFKLVMFSQVPNDPCLIYFDGTAQLGFPVGSAVKNLPAVQEMQQEL